MNDKSMQGLNDYSGPSIMEAEFKELPMNGKLVTPFQSISCVNTIDTNMNIIQNRVNGLLLSGTFNTHAT